MSQETESNNCFVNHCFEKKKRQTHRRKENELTLLLESCIARATYRLVSYLLADSSLI